MLDLGSEMKSNLHNYNNHKHNYVLLISDHLKTPKTHVFSGIEGRSLGVLNCCNLLDATQLNATKPWTFN